MERAKTVKNLLKVNGGQTASVNEAHDILFLSPCVREVRREGAVLNQVESGKLKVESLKRLKSEKCRVKNLHIQLWKNLFNIDFDTSPLSTLQSPLFKKAFTLAEVLITLGVIGVVAALTMPTLIYNYQKTQTINRLKASYSLLNNAIEMAKITNGLDINEWYIPEGEKPEVSDYFAEHYLIPYLKVIKDDCKAVDGCTINYKQLNGEDAKRENERVFTLASGTVVSVEAFYSDNVNDGKFRALLTIFINGLKKKNIMGHDIFRIELGGTGPNKNKFLPYYYRPNAGTVYDCKNKEDKGEGCFSLIMRQNWQITDDYPW